MDRSILVRAFGFKATLIHGDTLVLDRWLWLKRWLPVTKNGESLIDIGCGSGAFTIGAALRGYSAVGLSWDEGNQEMATTRAHLCNAVGTAFPIVDVRSLDTRNEFKGVFDVAICCENIEHILDDRKLMLAIGTCLKPGGRLLLTAPNYDYVPMSEGDKGPFSKIESGWHVRRGYTAAMLTELCDESGFRVENIGYCSGYLSQTITSIWRSIQSDILRFVVTLPLRMLPPILDRLIERLTGWPGYSICLVAYKPRWGAEHTRPNCKNK